MTQTMKKKVDMGDEQQKFDQIFAIEVCENSYMPYPIYPLHGEVIEDMHKNDEDNQDYDWTNVAQDFVKNVMNDYDGQVMFMNNNSLQTVTQNCKKNIFSDLEIWDEYSYHPLD